MLVHLLMMLPPDSTLVLNTNPVFSTETFLMIYLRVVLVHFLMVFPPDSTLVLNPDTMNSSESFLVIHLGLMLVHLLDMIPANGRLVLSVRLNSKLSTKALFIIWSGTGRI